MARTHERLDERVAVCTLPRGQVSRGLVAGLTDRGWQVGCIGMGDEPTSVLESPGAASDRVATTIACEFDGAAAVAAALAEVASATGPPSLLVHGFPLFEPPAPRPLLDIDEAGWTMACESTMKAALFTLQAFHDTVVAARADAPGAARRPATAVLLVPALALSGQPGHVALASAAEGIRALAKSAARQWGDTGITVQVVALDSAALLGERAAGSTPTALVTPALPAVDPERDLAALVSFLGSPEARQMTGQTFVVDAGTWMAR